MNRTISGFLVSVICDKGLWAGCSLRGIAALCARGEAMASRACEGAASGNKFFDLIRSVGG